MGGKDIDRAQRAATARRDWKPEFLEAVAECGVIAYAAASVGIGRRTVYNNRDSDHEFAAALDEALELSTAKLEREAFRRAVEGWDEQHVSGKGDVYSVRKYDSQLLQFLLRARRPAIYRERTDVHHSGTLGLNLMTLARMADEGRRELDRSSE